MENTKICKRCKYYTLIQLTHLCLYNIKKTIDLVTGETLLTSTKDCYDERSHIGDQQMKCGPQGKYFERKDEFTKI